MKYLPLTVQDIPEIVALYKRVAAKPGGIALLAEEVDEEYVEEFVARTISDGLGFVAREAESGKLVGEIHAYRPGIYCFSHVLSGLRIAVDPEIQGQGVGRAIFEKLLSDVVCHYTDIKRVELIVRESNTRAISFYESLGFVREGIFTGRIKNPDGTIESDIPMAWRRID
ncbi:GNAT family N-acetyltransferase [Rubritalea tangerina]|uniref:GNAT family N-acetyltransferase n=1 Tax=Rubritalea tangerina TaxID=430798 RepID=A0ABW4Z7J9_9BACT